MSLSPEPGLPVSPAPAQQPPSTLELVHPRRIWGSVVIGALTAGVGLYLAVAPWVDNWSFNYLQELHPTLEYLWEEPYFRGAISGLGLANLLIAAREILRAFSSASK